MKIVIAPDSYKDNLSSVAVASFIEEGIRKACPEAGIVKIPIADGGEGTVEALVTATDGRIEKLRVKGPLMEEVDTFFGILGDQETAIIEVAAVIGLAMIPQENRNPLNTTTFGVGELILAVVEKGYKKIIIGLGGSSTNDGGMGMLQALGVKFLDKDGMLLGYGGKFLPMVDSIDISDFDHRLKNVKITVASDITNPLIGPDGATYIYGPQKGASLDIVEYLDKGMQNYSNIIKYKLGSDVAKLPGSGAAGGLGAAFLAFMKADICPGIELVINYCNFENKVKDADLFITGEGKTDKQTAYGKVPVGLAKVAKKYEVPVVCISGSMGKGFEEVYRYGIDSVFSIVNRPMLLDEAMSRSGELLSDTAYSLMRLFKKLNSNRLID